LKRKSRNGSPGTGGKTKSLGLRAGRALLYSYPNYTKPRFAARHKTTSTVATLSPVACAIRAQSWCAPSDCAKRTRWRSGFAQSTPRFFARCHFVMPPIQGSVSHQLTLSAEDKNSASNLVRFAKTWSIAEAFPLCPNTSPVLPPPSTQGRTFFHILRATCSRIPEFRTTQANSAQNKPESVTKVKPSDHSASWV